MSDPGGRLDPAIGLLEFDSIVAGIVAGDAMAKSSPVAALYAGTVHPGRYLVLVGGGTAEVEIALETGAGDSVLDSLFLADVHPAVVTAITTRDVGCGVEGEALGIVEASSVATAIVAADAGAKAADVSLEALRLADGLGGSAYCLFTGVVADIEIAIETAVAGTEHRESRVRAGVIAQLHQEMRDNLEADLRFNHHLRQLDGAP
ncbi:MAG: BMC domain-containing protein [Microthrixaceae bacterium]